MMVKAVVWICVSGIVIGLTGFYAVFVMPLLWIGWKFSRSTFLQTPQEKAEIELDALVRVATARGAQQYLGDFAFQDLARYLKAIRPMIWIDFARFAVITHDLQFGNDAAKIVAIATIERWMEERHLGGGPAPVPPPEPK